MSYPGARKPGSRGKPIPGVQIEIERPSVDFKGYEKVRRFHVGEEDCSARSEMLTAALNLKRGIVQKRYDDAIESLYAH